VQAIDLPLLSAQGGRFAVLSIAAIALCVGLGLALAAAPADAARQLWRLVAAAAVLVLAGWAAPRAFAVPGLAHHQGHWTAPAGAACAVPAAGCLVLAVFAVPVSLRRSARGLATAVVVLVALAPGAGTLLVALGPGLQGGETSLAAGVHVHSHAGLDESQIRFEPIAGGRGGHYVYRTAAPPHRTAVGVALVVAAAFVFAYGAVGCLRRRRAPLEPVAAPGVGSVPA
jgi:hypothetical protein